MNSKDLQHFIDERRIVAEIIFLAGHTPTVADAARELGVGTEQIIKSLVFQVRDEPILVINNGLAKVDQRRVAAHLEVGRKWVRFANPDQVLELTGYIVGSMPPFGHMNRLRTLVDSAIVEMPEVFGGGGDLDAMMRLAPKELIRVTEAEIVSLSQD